jgi:hypothetical protein
MSNVQLRTHLSFPQRIHDNLTNRIIALTASEIHATVRGTDGSVLPGLFQTLPADGTGAVIQFGYVVEDPVNMWDSVNYRFAIPETGSYFMTFGLCAPDILTGVIGNPTEQIYEYGATFRILNSDGVTIREDFGKQTSVGGVGATINAIHTINNRVDVNTCNSGVILPLNAGEYVQLVGLVNTNATPSASLGLDLVDPAASPAPGTSTASSWMSIMKI